VILDNYMLGPCCHVTLRYGRINETSERALKTKMKMLADRQASLPGTERQVNQEIVKIEKNLNSLGFFSPARRKGEKAKEIRTITYPPRDINGTRVRQTATIIPSRQHGQPTTADRDKYMAFMKIVTEQKARVGEVQNPVAFTTYELLRYLGLSDSGTNFREVTQWIDRMVSTTIRSENAVYLNKGKRYAIDIFHVFDRAVLAGQELEDGSVAQMNYVYLSKWQLENINSNFLLPIDLYSYLQLRRDVAKALFGHLHTWFFASRGGKVETRYSYLCELLDIQRWAHLSRIKQALEPALEELKAIDYVQSWFIERTIDKSDFKLVLYPGQKILRTGRPRLAATMNNGGVIDVEFEKTVRALVERGVREDTARRLLLDVPEEQQVGDQLEYFDDLLRKSGRTILNPPGFLVTMVRENWTVPVDLVRTRRLGLQQRAEQNKGNPSAVIEAKLELRRLELQEKYQTYLEESIERGIRAAYVGDSLQKKLKALKKQVVAKHPELYPKNLDGWVLCPALEQHARRALSDEIQSTLTLMSLEEFSQQSQSSLF
jgi:hypothetical protein